MIDPKEFMMAMAFVSTFAVIVWLVLQRMAKKQPATNEIVIPYTLRPLQKEFHLNSRRWNVAVCHRRFGKTLMSIHWLVRCLIECQHRNPQGALYSPNVPTG